MVPVWQFGLTGILAVALVTDLQSRKIYNWLTFPAMIAGLVLSVAFGGPSSVSDVTMSVSSGTAMLLASSPASSSA